MDHLEHDLDTIAGETRFSGAVRLDRGKRVQFAKAYGLADRAHEIPNTVDTQFALASGTKGLTALVIVGLIEEGLLGLETTARSLLGDDLPLISGEVTIEHLLSHRSGIGDYIDEEAGLDVTDYVLPVPVHELAITTDYLRVLECHPPKFAAGKSFSYCNSGYIVLALIAERVSRRAFGVLVRERVCVPAGMKETEFLRSDELHGRAARGYLSLDGHRTNVFHLPLCGSGDGGIYSTLADIHRLWSAVFDGRIVSPHWVEEMVRPRSDISSKGKAYGMGFWLNRSDDSVVLEGCDAGVSFVSVHARAARITWTAVSNTSDGAWPIARHLKESLVP